jgi:hypothetical protein
MRHSPPPRCFFAKSAESIGTTGVKPFEERTFAHKSVEALEKKADESAREEGFDCGRDDIRLGLSARAAKIRRIAATVKTLF